MIRDCLVRKSLEFITILFLFFNLNIIANGAINSGPKKNKKPKITQEYHNKTSLFFEPNQGQTDSDVKFLLRGVDATLFLTMDEAVLTLFKISKDLTAKNTKGFKTGKAANKSSNAKETVIRIRLQGANKQTEIVGEGTLPGCSNYLVGQDAYNWYTGIPHFGRVKYKNIYPGIDLVFHGNQKQLEYDFVVKAGAKPSDISLKFFGVETLAIDREGNLVLHTNLGDIVQKSPEIYQKINGQKVSIKGGYFLKKDRTVGFKVASYDRSKKLVIDPVIVYSTYLGGGSAELFGDVAIDSQGNAYVTGQTSSTNFPIINSPYSSQALRAADIFIVKLSPEGQVLFSTYFGGSDVDRGEAIAVDANGDIYVTGTTSSSDFPAKNAIGSSYGGGGDAFVSKISSNGKSLIYSSFIGGSAWEVGTDIAVDPQGEACITGYVASHDFPTFNALYPNYNGGDKDIFITKIAADGQSFVYSTYYGGSNVDEGYGITTDSNGQVYVTGRTWSNDFPTINALFEIFGGAEDAFVTKISSDGQNIIYSSYLGGNSNDVGRGIAVNQVGDAFITGFTYSEDFPTVNAKYQEMRGYSDAFVAKFASNGQSLIFSTFLGGNSFDWGYGIALDTRNNITIVGTTRSTDFPTINAIYPEYRGGENDAFITKFSFEGQTIIYSTYFGGSSYDYGFGVALDSHGNTYITGETESSDFPTVSALYPDIGGIQDIFLVKIRKKVKVTENYNPLPDTGQHKCYDGVGTEIVCPPPGDPMAQDGSYDAAQGKVQMSFTDNGDGTITDDNTGLMWQQADSGTIRTWQGAIDYCEGLSLAGHEDWRLPNVFELTTIVDYGRYNFAIAPIFSSTGEMYWSSDICPACSNRNNSAIDFSIDLGAEGCGYKSSPLYVRCVRGKIFTSGPYKDNEDGTITDENTGLMWQKSTADINGDGVIDRNDALTWELAINYCEDLSFAGYSDWRLPDFRELRSLVDENGGYYWSATTIADGTSGAWGVDCSCKADFTTSKSSYNFVRCVRGGLSGSSSSSIITTPPHRITPEPISQSPSGSTKAVVITHGWNSNADGWVLEMAKDICNSIEATNFTSFYYNPEPNKFMPICYGNGWDVFIADWRDLAFGPEPGLVWLKAPYIGEVIATSLFYQPYSHYDHIHLIAHSAGSNLIESATRQLKTMGARNGRYIAIHETFLDAFDPRSFLLRSGGSLLSDYGKKADWADNYVDTRPVLLVLGSRDGTQLFLRNAYNIDVTSSVLEWCGITCRHDRPVRFYGKSISWDFIGDASHAEHDPIESTDGVGFPLSLENGHSMSGLNQAYPKGKKCIMDGSTCYQGSLPPSTLHYFPSELKETTVKTVKGTIDYIKGTGATLLHELRVTLAPTVYSYAVPSQSSGVMAAQEAGDEPTEEPAWIIFKVTTEAPVNTLRFNWKFDEGGEGFLRIFVDDRLVREMDQRFLLPESTEAEEVYIGDANGTLPAGEHEIAFRLDGFSSNGTSGVELTDVELLEKELSAASVELGDANGDGQINVLDVISVINKILNPNASVSGDADCNGDGTVNVLDVICIINKILQGI